MSKLKAIFLDRDGIINIDKEYLYKIEEFEFTLGIIETLQYLSALDYILFVVTNQSGIGRGYYSKDQFETLNSWMVEQLKQNDIKISQVEYCPHTPEDNCNCRKPNIKMLENILVNYDIDLEKSWMIGDKKSDIDFAINGGIKNSIFYDTSKYDTGNIDATFVIKDLIKIKEII